MSSQPNETEGHDLSVEHPVTETTPTDVEVLTTDGHSYTTKGRTRVATPDGYNLAIPGFPLITPEGILVTKDEANALYEFASQHGVTLSVTTSTEKEN